MNGPTTSYWNKTAEKTRYPRLEKNLETDTLIIGGGITGVTCAYCLAQKGAKPVLIEAGGLCDGTTGSTTGKVTIQHGIIYGNLLSKYGRDFAKGYAESQTGALEFVEETVEAEAIHCQLLTCSSFIYASDDGDRETLQKECDAAKSIGIDAEYGNSLPFPEKNYGMLEFKNQHAFHPVRYVEGLAKAAVKRGAAIYGDTKAVKVDNGEPVVVLCENNIVIKARHLIMATQYPIFDGPNIYYTRLYPDRDYGIAATVQRDWPGGNYINTGKVGRSIRTHVENGRKVLIAVGENHFPGRGQEDAERHYDSLFQFADSLAGVQDVMARWSAQDYKTPDQVSYIGRNAEHGNIFVATGYGKWGLSNGTLAGMMLSDMITKGGSPYEELYSRRRGDITSSLGTVLSEVFGSVGELIKSKLESVDSLWGLKPGEGCVVRYKGQKTGIFRDYDDTVTILDISCTHLGTELNFNDAEKTWDCPAHGGRFSADGRLLEGPPKDNLKVLFKGKYEELTTKEYSLR